jgi:tetratricopeptide (TPR) repeat protein
MYDDLTAGENLRLYAHLYGVADPLTGVRAAAARAETRYWFDSVSLFERAIAVTSDNTQAHCHLATAYARRGRVEDAIAQYREALRIDPTEVGALSSLAEPRNSEQSWVSNAEKGYLDMMSIWRLGESKIHSTFRFEGVFVFSGEQITGGKLR